MNIQSLNLPFTNWKSFVQTDTPKFFIVLKGRFDTQSDTRLNKLLDLAIKIISQVYVRSATMPEPTAEFLRNIQPSNLHQLQHWIAEASNTMDKYLSILSESMLSPLSDSSSDETPAFDSESSQPRSSTFAITQASRLVPGDTSLHLPEIKPSHMRVKRGDPVVSEPFSNALELYASINTLTPHTRKLAATRLALSDIFIDKYVTPTYTGDHIIKSNQIPWNLDGTPLTPGLSWVTNLTFIDFNSIFHGLLSGSSNDTEVLNSMMFAILNYFVHHNPTFVDTKFADAETIKRVYKDFQPLEFTSEMICTTKKIIDKTKKYTIITPTVNFYDALWKLYMISSTMIKILRSEEEYYTALISELSFAKDDTNVDGYPQYILKFAEFDIVHRGMNFSKNTQIKTKYNYVDVNTTYDIHDTNRLAIAVLSIFAGCFITPLTDAQKKAFRFWLTSINTSPFCASGVWSPYKGSSAGTFPFNALSVNSTTNAYLPNLLYSRSRRLFLYFLRSLMN